MTKSSFPQGGQKQWQSKNTGYRTPSYGSNSVSEKRNTAATKAQPMYQGGGNSKAAKGGK